MSLLLFRMYSRLVGFGGHTFIPVSTHTSFTRISIIHFFSGCTNKCVGWIVGGTYDLFGIVQGVKLGNKYHTLLCLVCSRVSTTNLSFIMYMSWIVG